MDLEIFKKKEKESDKTRLAFRKDGCGNIDVIVVDEDGDKRYAGTLLTINKDGTIERCHNMNDDLGFKLDCSGRIKLRE